MESSSVTAPGGAGGRATCGMGMAGTNGLNDNRAHNQWLLSPKCDNPCKSYTHRLPIGLAYRSTGSIDLGVSIWSNLGLDASTLIPTPPLVTQMPMALQWLGEDVDLRVDAVRVSLTGPYWFAANPLQ